MLLLQQMKQLAQSSNELMPYDPVADPSAVVVSPDGKARFTVLSPEIIRMEYTETAHSFEDRPSIAFVNRKQPVPSFHASPLGSNGVSLNTSAVSLTYTGGNFSADSIQVVSTDSSSAFQKWNGGMQSSTDPGNLLGTFRTLDGTGSVSLNCTENKKVQCEFGLISRSGWALVVDSFDRSGTATTGGRILAGPCTERNSTVDWYLFAHGHDYKGALKAYTQIGGHIPVYPRAMSGVMWSRWYNMDARDVLDLINDYESRGLPLDVHILDMNWHLKNDWTGYSWDPRLIPNATDLMQYVTEERKLMQFVNLHDADGIAAWETQYEAMCECTKSDCSQGATIKADFSSKTYVRCLEDVVMKPLYDIGVHGWDRLAAVALAGAPQQRENSTHDPHGLAEGHIPEEAGQRQARGRAGQVRGASAPTGTRRGSVETWLASPGTIWPFSRISRLGPPTWGTVRGRTTSLAPRATTRCTRGGPSSSSTLALPVRTTAA